MYGILNNTMSNFLGGDLAVSEFDTVSSIVAKAAYWLMFLAFGLSFVALAFSFIQFIISNGDVKNLEKAKTSLLWAGIGMFVTLLAYTAHRILINTLGVSGLESY